jgi:hypothetical protein
MRLFKKMDYGLWIMRRSSTCAIVGWIVCSKDLETRKFSNRHLGDERKQVVWDSLGILSNVPAWMSSDGIEVTQQSNLPVVYVIRQKKKKELQRSNKTGPPSKHDMSGLTWFSNRKILENGFDEQLCASIGRQA